MTTWTSTLSQENGEGHGPCDPENCFVVSMTFTVLDLQEGGIKTGFDSLFLRQKGHAFMTLNNALFQILSTGERVPFAVQLPVWEISPWTCFVRD